MQFVTERGSTYMLLEDGSTIRMRKDDNGENWVKQPQSTLTIFITEDTLDDMRKEWGNDTFTFPYTTEPKEGLLPLEIWVSVKRQRNMAFLKNSTLWLYDPKSWINGKDFHIGNKIIAVKKDIIKHI